MIFLEGFFRSSFPPVAVLALLGVACLLLHRKKLGMKRQLIWFVAGALLFMAAWRMPVVISKRYMMPMAIPGIVLATYLLLQLSGVLRQRLRRGRAAAGLCIVVAIIVLTSFLKIGQRQEPKPYLKEIPAALQADAGRNGHDRPLVLILGKPGGSLTWSPKAEIRPLALQAPNQRFLSPAESLLRLQRDADLKELTASYPAVYIFSIESQDSDFLSVLQNSFPFRFDLVYEHVREKDRSRHRLYRVDSSYHPSVPEDQFEHLMSIHNLVRNPDFQLTRKVGNGDPELKALHERGIRLWAGSEGELPQDWHVNPAHGWDAKASPVSLRWQGGPAPEFQVKSNDYVTFHSPPLSARKEYLAMLETAANGSGRVSLAAYLYDKEGRFVQSYQLRVFDCIASKRRYIFEIAALPGECWSLTLGCSGTVNLSELRIAEKSNFQP